VATAKPQEIAADGIYPAVTPLIAQSEHAAERSFEKLYQRHVHAVYRYSLAVLHNEADAEDVTQTTFLSAFRAFQRGERPYRPHNWLIKIAHNVCRQRFRDSSRRPQEVEFDESHAAATTYDDDDVPTAGDIRRALGFLAFNQRAALVMRELEGRSYAEIAQILDLSVGAVETLIFRARRALREQLEGGLTCEEAELTLSRLDERRLSSSERGALRAHLRECKDCAMLERRQRAQRAALKNLGAVPLPASLAGSFFGGGAVGGGVAAGGMGIGAKIATVLAAGVVATGVGREAVEAVQASNGPSSPSKPAAVVDNPAFSPISAITNGRAGASPLATQLKGKKRATKADRRGSSGASKARRGIAAGGSQQGAPTGGTEGGVGSNAPSLPQAPETQRPRIQVPQTPRVPVPVPTVQVPTIQVPTIQVPTVQVPPVPVPPVPLPPPPIP
jgi:RNA polymerase sigma-70 factor, ECF subfamily